MKEKISSVFGRLSLIPMVFMLMCFCSNVFAAQVPVEVSLNLGSYTGLKVYKSDATGKMLKLVGAVQRDKNDTFRIKENTQYSYYLIVPDQVKSMYTLNIMKVKVNNVSMNSSRVTIKNGQSSSHMYEKETYFLFYTLKNAKYLVKVKNY